MSSHSPPQKWGIQANWINPKSCMRLAEWCKNNIVSQDICDSLFFNIKASNKFHNFEFSSGFNSPSYLYQSQLNQILISNIMIEYYFFGLGHNQSQLCPRLILFSRINFSCILFSLVSDHLQQFVDHFLLQFRAVTNDQ